MPRRGEAIARAHTKLARLRADAGIPQIEFATALGMSVATYRKLERGELANPPLRYLTNAAIALGVELSDVLEEEWRGWAVLDERAAKPPDWATRQSK